MYGVEQSGAYNNRCSTAIIAKDGWEASGRWDGSNSGRPGIWIKSRNFTIATIHCTSGGVGRGDLRPFMTHMANVIGVNTPLVIGGDFNDSSLVNVTNLNAGTINRPIQFSVYTQSRATHSGGQVLDGFVSLNAIINTSRRYSVTVSDHDPVSATFR